ncbi:MAG: hypothetical protein H0X07_02650 [Gemmatimonadales bacterium]|nr:hypothetical protein [Gemmatimonadales bacterium]
MHSFLRMRNALLAGLCALALSAIVTGAADAKPKPGNPSKGFRLFARPLGALVINRIYCGLSSTGEICVDSTNSSTLGGGYWPRGTADQYVFNSGIQIAGIIGPDANPEWQGDTTGAQLFNPRGDSHGEEIRPIYNASNPDDVANWPAAALVPQGDASEELFNPLLRGRVSASQGDVWFLSWEGNPAFSSGREHPLGILVEQRGLGYNFPAGNEDILYFIYTFYNVTARDPAAYAAARPAMRDILVEAGNRFQDINEQRFGIQIPESGYTLTSLFAAFGADMDVADAGANYASVNVPFSLGYTYENTFTGLPSWTYDPSIFSPPFFPGAGFVGVKYLKSPIDPVTGAEVGLTFFSNTINSGAFDDASNVTQLYRYLSNNVSVTAGDAACNTGDPRATRICYINNGQEDDMRFFQASGPLELAPGGFGSIVVAYIFAAPVSVGACVASGSCNVKPGDPTRLSDPVRLAQGANTVDSVSGYAGFRGATPEGTVVQDSISVVPGSLLGKALVAQEVFRNQFLLPFAPETPDFFLIPGDDQVTVLWRPSASEGLGDPFFAIANAPLTPEGAINPLYDPNYRQNDVEGYRVYRGRVDSPQSLQLLAQFDYSGTLITDFQGQVNPIPSCAPEIGITAGCAVAFDPLVPGTAPTVSVDIPLVGPISQVSRPNRAALATGEAILLSADTAITGAAGGCLNFGKASECELRDTGVPFVYVDQTARNNLRYFYSVTAFDINSFQSGPSSLESPRTTKSITPAAPAANFQSTASLTQSITGRGVTVSNDSTVPTIDPATGRFSGKSPPANNAQIGFVGQLAQSIFSGEGTFSATLIGIGLGDARNGIPAAYTYETSSSSGVLDTVTVSIAQPLDLANPTAGSTPFPAALSDPTLAARFGVPAGYVQNGQVTQGITAYQAHNAFGRGCQIDGLFGDAGDCTYNGPRWFSGANETKADPNAGNVAGTGDAVDNNNAGELPGVLTIQNPQSYHQVGGGYRAIESFLAGAVRAADFNVYWGVGGLVDSVVDLTHNVPVPFMADSVGGGWGFLNQANTTGAGSGDARPADLTLLDYGCVFPLINPARQPDQGLGCTAAAPYTLSNTAVPGSTVISGGGPADIAVAAPRPNPGFSMYLAGQVFLFELAPGGAVPAPGTIWSMRSYIGYVNGGNGAGGALGPYSFTPVPRTFTALGASLTLNYSATNTVVAATDGDLGQVHTVPDPYYVTSAFEQTTDTKVIKFVNLPNDCIIRIYSSSGVLVDLIEHHSTTFGGSEDWNVRNRNNQVVASGVYFFHVEAGGARRVGRFTVVNFAQ